MCSFCCCLTASHPPIVPNSLKTPLRSANDVLCEYLNDSLSTKKDTSCKTGIVAMKVFATIICFVGKAAFINLSLSVVGKTFFGWSVTLADVVGWGILSSWGYCSLIDTIFDDLPSQLREHQSTIRKVIVIAIAAGFSLFTIFPGAYITYITNDKKLYLPVFLILSNLGISCYFRKKTLDYIIETLSSNENRKTVQKKKTYLTRQIRNLETAPDATLKSIDNKDFTNIIKTALSFHGNTHENKISKSCVKILDCFFKVIAAAITVVYVSLITFVGGKGFYKEIKSSYAASITLSFFLFLGLIYLGKTQIFDSGISHLNFLKEIICRDLKKGFHLRNISGIFIPMVITAVIFASLSWAPIIGMSQHVFKPQELQLGIGIPASIGGGVLILTPMLSVAKKISEKILDYVSSDPEEVKELKTYQNIQKVCSIFSRINLDALDSFISNSDYSIKSALENGIKKK